MACFLFTIGSIVFTLLKMDYISHLFVKSYIATFLSYWFGFITFWTIGIIKQEGSYSPGLFSIPFWFFGLVVLYKEFIKPIL